MCDFYFVLYSSCEIQNKYNLLCVWLFFMSTLKMLQKVIKVVAKEQKIKLVNWIQLLKKLVICKNFISLISWQQSVYTCQVENSSGSPVMMRSCCCCLSSESWTACGHNTVIMILSAGINTCLDWHQLSAGWTDCQSWTYPFLQSQCTEQKWIFYIILRQPGDTNWNMAWQTLNIHWLPVGVISRDLVIIIC